MRRSLFALLAVAFALWPFGAIAGTTGGLSGIVTEAGTSTPVAGARITVTSPSQVANTTTDAAGRFHFVSLAPDEYVATIEKDGYDPASYPGIGVFADAQQTLTFSLRKTLRTIAHVASRSGSSLVRPGTTADIYSVGAQQQERLSGLGGGGNLNSAYSAISTVPGAYVPANQNGYNQAVHVRGGDAYEVGYEFDGIPVNRAFDNYPSSSLSSLGQLELQVYTGATPSNAEAQGLAGFINQVIKTGTYPGYASINPSIGTPTFYHSLNVEAGGATPDRLFSYYVGIGGFNQEHRYVDQFGGAAYTDEFGQQLGRCPSTPDPALSSCYTNGKPNVGTNGRPGWILGPIGFGTADAANIATRTSIINLHFGIPHKNNGLRDDVQLLYDNDEIFTTFFSSVNDEGLNNYLATVSPAPGQSSPFPPYYLDSYQYRGPLGQVLPSNYRSLVTPYYYPSSPEHSLFGPIPDPYNQRDRGYNGQAIVKLQYQKNFSSNAFLRVYGYTYYSDWIENGPMMSLQPYAYYDSGDYEINNHTRGFSASFTDQLNSQNLLQAEASYTTASGERIYNEQMFGYTDSFAVLVNPNAIGSGTCYIAPASGHGAATPTTCADGAGSNTAYGSLPTFASLSGIYSGTGLPPSASNMTCGGGHCAYYAAENGAVGLVNTVVPAFTGYSLTDEWRPSDRIAVNAGVRVDNYSFTGTDTNTGAARDFWFDSFNQDTCYDKQTLGLVDRSSFGGSWSTNSQKPCSAFGSQYVNAHMQNARYKSTYTIVQPRIGATYTVNPDTVLRASWGKYNEQPSSAYEQYDSLEQNLPDTLTEFYSLGFNTPGHSVAPSISFNSDFSIEHHFHGTDISFKLTPFLRQTQNEVENFYINYTSGITSGLNAGNQTSKGFEFELNKGDFARNGLSGQVSFAYTYATVKYGLLPNGTTILDPINAGIAQYNAYTKACTPGGAQYGKRQFGQAVCGATSDGAVAARCYTPGGAPDPTCHRPNDVANPYWLSPAFTLYDPSASYIPYSTFPGPVGSGVNAYNYPYVATLILNYKHNRFSITPSLQFQAGNRYGAPLTTPGIDPASGCGALVGSTTGDPRYPYGASGGQPYGVGFGQCKASLSIPDPYTGQFDAIGAFREPAQLLGNLRLAYEISPRVSVSVTLTNLLQTCFGGQTTGFTYFSGSGVCSYGDLVGGPSTAPVGNAYNPGANVQTFLRYPYEPSFGTYDDLTNAVNQPFNAYVSLKVQISSQRYDAIIIGGGHNGLVTACYLARAKWKVLVLERRYIVGGACVSEEIWPGYKVSTAAYVNSLFRPEIIADLRMRDYGFEPIERNPASFSPFDDGRYLMLGTGSHRDVEEIAKFSKRDAERYPQYEKMLERVASVVEPTLVQVPPNLLRPSAGQLLQMGKMGRALQKLGPGMGEAIEVLTGAARPILDRWFESEQLKATIATDAIIGAFMAPSMPGTAYVLFHHVMGETNGKRGVWSYVKGGMGGLTQALAGAAKDLGVEIRTEAEVAKILTKNGAVTGVAMSNGDEFSAAKVASGVDCHLTFQKLLDPAELPPAFNDAVGRISYSSASCKINVALERLPSFTALPGHEAGPQHRGTVHLCPDQDFIERAYDEAKFGKMSSEPVVECTMPSSLDPTIAPPGKHLMSMFTQYAPYELADGPWTDAKRNEYADRCFAVVERYAPGFTESVIARQVLTPVNLESTFGLTGGSIFQGAMPLHQLFAFRPVPGFAGYNTPIKGLFMCGAATHPGGGVMGASGWNAARVMLKSR